MIRQNSSSPPEPGARVIRSAVAAVAIAWTLRFIGLFSVLVLARVLTPADFGVAALAMSVLALVDVFSALGLRQALLRIPDPSREHYDTAWTLQLGVLTLLALILVALGPLAAWFYQEPALRAVIAVLACCFVIDGLANIGTVDFDRRLDLGRDLRMRVCVRLLSFAVTVSAALVLRNYWALVIGAVAQSAFQAIATYVCHPFRPRFGLSRRAELLGVSLWMFLDYAAQTLHNQIERLVVGRIAPAQVVGGYSVSRDLSAIFTQEIATALNRVTFVTTAQADRPLRDDPGRLAAMLGAYALIAAPLGLGLSAAAAEVVPVLLGPQWQGAAQYLAIVAPACALYAVVKLIVSTLQASGDARHGALLSASGAALTIAAVTAAAAFREDAIAVAAAALAATITLTVGGVLLLARKARSAALPLILAVARPFLAGMGMAAIVSQFAVAGLPPLAGLAGKVAAGAAIYAVLVLCLWAASGKPRGAEHMLLALIGQHLRRYPKPC